MKRRSQQIPEAGAAFDLIEEATALVRSAPKSTLAAYFIGAVPFVMAFLYFWTDMSRNPFARQLAGAEALGIAVLFIWMKYWQAVYCRRLHAHHTTHPVPRWSWRQSFEVVLSQTILHSMGLFLLPLATLLVLPLPWVYAFFQNVTALASPGLSSSQLRKSAWRQASLWPWPNHILLGVLLLFGVFVFVNWIGVFVILPALVKSFLGIETAFSRSPGAVLNTTSLMAAFWMAYLCVDPILKAAYLLRCFYGEARHSGEDLKTGLRQTASAGRALLAGFLMLMIVGLLPTGGWAQSRGGEPAAESSSVSPAELDETIDRVIHQSRYSWRMPRDGSPDTEEGLLSRFINSIFGYLRDFLRVIAEWIERLLEWIFDRPGSIGGPGGFDTLSRTLPYLLIVLAVVVLAGVLFYVGRRRKTTAPVAAAVAAAPDLSSENVAADQLPEDGWTTLGRDLVERGEFRMAIRAFYLATLAHLAQRHLVGIARFKSNREYEHELRRRAHAIPEMCALFSENLFTFERVWYGKHEVNRDLAQQFAAVVDRIRSAA